MSGLYAAALYSNSSRSRVGRRSAERCLEVFLDGLVDGERRKEAAPFFTSRIKSRALKRLWFSSLYHAARTPTRGAFRNAHFLTSTSCLAFLARSHQKKCNTPTLSLSLTRTAPGVGVKLSSTRELFSRLECRVCARSPNIYEKMSTKKTHDGSLQSFHE